MSDHITFAFIEVNDGGVGGGGRGDDDADDGDDSDDDPVCL